MFVVPVFLSTSLPSTSVGSWQQTLLNDLVLTCLLTYKDLYFIELPN